jgi:hypothetical protein
MKVRKNAITKSSWNSGHLSHEYRIYRIRWLFYFARDVNMMLKI